MQSKSGFTIVELLIVIVVIGILAAITVVAFNGVTARANETSAKSDVKSNMRNILLFRVEKSTELNCGDFTTSDQSINPYPFKLSNRDTIKESVVSATYPDWSRGWPAFIEPYGVAYVIVLKSGKVFASASGSPEPRDITSFYTAAGDDIGGAIQGAYSVVTGAGCAIL